MHLYTRFGAQSNSHTLSLHPSIGQHKQTRPFSSTPMIRTIDRDSLWDTIDVSRPQNSFCVAPYQPDFIHGIAPVDRSQQHQANESQDEGKGSEIPKSKHSTMRKVK